MANADIGKHLSYQARKRLKIASRAPNQEARGRSYSLKEAEEDMGACTSSILVEKSSLHSGFPPRSGSVRELSSKDE